jgi:hypothetical protein
MMASMANIITPDVILMNGKGPYGHSLSKAYESFIVTQGKITSSHPKNEKKEKPKLWEFGIRSIRLIVLCD